MTPATALDRIEAEALRHIRCMAALPDALVILETATRYLLPVERVTELVARERGDGGQAGAP